MKKLYRKAKNSQKQNAKNQQKKNKYKMYVQDEEYCYSKSIVYPVFRKVGHIYDYNKTEI